MARTLVKAILAEPASYYVNVHTAEFPAGAIRGQLDRHLDDARSAPCSPRAKGHERAERDRHGGAARPKDKGPSVTGCMLRTSRCRRLAAHIHKGAAGVERPGRRSVHRPGRGRQFERLPTSTPEIVNEILGNPSGFYVNVHTTEHPAGAIRAQLG